MEHEAHMMMRVKSKGSIIQSNPGEIITPNKSAKISSPAYWTVYDIDTLTADKENTIKDESEQRKRKVSKRRIFIYSSIKTDTTQTMKHRVQLWPRTEQMVVNL